MTSRQIGTREEWLEARNKLLEREKEHTRLGDEVAQLRRELPWVPIEKEYRFDTDDGQTTLDELFMGRSQLLVYHFMFGPSYQAGDAVNSSIADSIDRMLPHLQARDATLVMVSQGPVERLAAYKQRMGWAVPWVSSAPGDFNFDLGFSQEEEQSREAVTAMSTNAGGRPIGDALPPVVEQNMRAAGTDLTGYLTESPGFSAFVHEGGTSYHTYSTTWRGLEFLMTYYGILDRAPYGRDEGEDWQLWLRRHDEYASV